MVGVSSGMDLGAVKFDYARSLATLGTKALFATLDGEKNQVFSSLTTVKLASGESKQLISCSILNGSAFQHATVDNANFLVDPKDGKVYMSQSMENNSFEDRMLRDDRDSVPDVAVSRSTGKPIVIDDLSLTAIKLSVGLKK